MVISVEEYQQLKKRAEKARADADRAQGALEQQLQKLENEFDCRTIEEAEELLGKLQKEEQEAEQSYQKELEVFEEKWGEQLDDNVP